MCSSGKDSPPPLPAAALGHMTLAGVRMQRLPQQAKTEKKGQGPPPRPAGGRVPDGTAACKEAPRGLLSHALLARGARLHDAVPDLASNVRNGAGTVGQKDGLGLGV
eukprot:CAMPEP_0168423396 /NCGR_PEP_ID=MMETSP0228-20121227/34286_1 /TAXON_ID=133427 /ORGANISM="Protoceratium reticulatum, Strain CCCM 535 (=CCMP 1889)" /LENGTH=106 /DNA_ID=CAMNT_0008437355 /DNA_START=140 /DNA_END=458 /DNA_ORIENTATION=+